MTQQESYLIDAESKVRELDDEHFIQLVTAEIEERNDNVMSNAEARRNATRVKNFLTTLLEFDAA
jgi:hypothetical protein